MKIKTVNVRRTINLLNYNSLSIELAAEIGDKEDVQEVMEKLDNSIIDFGREKFLQMREYSDTEDWIEDQD